MINDIQNVVAAFVHLAVACTFGLSLAIGVAGVLHSVNPLGCNSCGQTFAVAKVVPKI